MKNRFKLFGIIAVVAVVGFSMTGCDQVTDPVEQTQWTISFIRNHTAMDNATVNYFIHTNGGQFPASVATPSARPGWTFTGYWTTRGNGTRYFDAGGARTAAAGNPRTLYNDLRLYAQWSQDETPPTDPDQQPPDSDQRPPDSETGPTPPTDEQIPANIVGAWVNNTRYQVLVLNTDGTVVVMEEGTVLNEGTISVSGNEFSITFPDYDDPIIITGTFSQAGNTLTLNFSWGDTEVFNRQGTWTASPVGYPTTIGIDFTFAGTPTGLVESDITITPESGSADRGTLSGSGLTRTLSLFNVTAGTIRITIGRDGIDSEPRTVALIAHVPPPPPPRQPDVLTEVSLEGFTGIAVSGSATFTLGTTYDGEFVDFRMGNRSADWHAMDIQFPALIAAGYLSADGTYTLRVTGRGGEAAAGHFMIQGIQPGHDWGNLVSLALDAPFTISRNFTMQAGPGPWTGNPRWAAARLTTDGDGANSDIIFTDIEIVNVPGNEVVWNLADVVIVEDVPDITWVATPAGSPTTTTINFSFSADPGALGASDIAINSMTGSATRGLLTGSGTARTLSVTGVSTGTVSVSINRDGIDGEPQIMTLIAAPITWSVFPAGSIQAGTNSLSFSFSAVPTGLAASDITITPITGSATRGNLTGTGTVRSLSVSNVTSGTVSISISRAGFASGPQTVTLEAHPGAQPPTPPPVGNIAWTVRAEAGTITPSITFGFLGDPGALTAAQITITPGTGSATRGTLSGSGLTRTLTLTNVTAGTVNISINRAGIVPGPVQVTLSGGAAPPTTGPRITVTGIPAQFNGRLAQVVLQQTGATRTTTTVMITSGAVTMALPTDQIIAGNFSAQLTIFGPPLHERFNAPSRPISGTANTNIPWRYFSP